jgi:hypothetical protein
MPIIMNVDRERGEVRAVAVGAITFEDVTDYIFLRVSTFRGAPCVVAIAISPALRQVEKRTPTPTARLRPVCQWIDEIPRLYLGGGEGFYGAGL